MANTNYTFTQPVRYYKANDPYFYEVDNLPIRQLEENILHLKERMETPEDVDPDDPEFEAVNDRFLTGNSEISITSIKELRPKIVSGRTIKVNAGKFVARVNDTFDVSKPLTSIIKAYTGPPGQGLGIPIVTPDLLRLWGINQKEAVWDEFINSMGTGGAPYNMNGLEVNYTFYSTPGEVGGNWGWRTNPVGDAQVGDCATHPTHWGYPFYNFPGDWWDIMTWPQVDSIKALSPGGSNQGTAISSNLTWNSQDLVNLHQEFVKLWRSPFRTAVVDVPNSTIQIPTFNSDDFRYMEQQLQVSSLEEHATHRIDLLVVYTMSIDSSSTTLNNYSDSICNLTPTPKTIHQPVLGLVRGAGFGLTRGYNTCYDDPRSINAYNECAEAAGNHGVAVGDPKILGNINDESTTANYGITDKVNRKIHGSFPSPDDLLNLAPILAFDGVSSTDFQRIGQTALPLAYIVVTKDTVNLTQNDIIDIRPFLRTTEFTYNERAGIAAANPPLSLANPAVGAYQLQDIVNQVYNTIGGIDTGGGGGTNTVDTLGKVLYTDYVMGGLGFGVEGTLLTMNNNAGAPADPWGSITQTAAYGGEIFSTYTNSKNYLDDTNLSRRQALLTYFYNMRQSDLKQWLANPNSTIAGNGNYLNLPEKRNIPLFPEWDPPVDHTNYAQAQQGVGGQGYQTPQPTWWMWFEGVNRRRSWRYVPGGVVSTKNADGHAALDKQYLQGYSPGSSSDEEYTAFTQIASKKIEVVFPPWVNDYDVLVEYVNCQPMSYAGDDVGGDTFEPHLGLGSGLSVNKGPLKIIGNEHRATFQIGSAGQSIPANDMLSNSTGQIRDNVTISPVQNAYYKFLTYAVILPEFRETGWRTQDQAGQNNAPYLSFTPKAGAAYYPTVKFTLIGYTDNKITYNTSLDDNGTLIPSNSVGLEDVLQHATHAPVYDTTVVNIQSLE